MTHIRPAGSKTTSPIWVRRDTDYLGRNGYRWTCDVHTRAKGFHGLDTRTDRYLRRVGKARPHPWLRCLAGAVGHWHRYHAKPHGCCLVIDRTTMGYQTPVRITLAGNAPPIIPVAEPPSQPAMPPTLTSRDHCPH